MTCRSLELCDTSCEARLQPSATEAVCHLDTEQKLVYMRRHPGKFDVIQRVLNGICIIYKLTVDSTFVCVM